MTLKQKFISGLYWSMFNDIVGYAINFFFGIILARILDPKEFGLIGMIAIFIAISQSFIDSGFSNALIRRKKCSQLDYSTVFYYNLLVSIIFCLILLFGANGISALFREPLLKSLIQVLSLGLIINSLGIIHRTILTISINFKLQTRISIISSLISGTTALLCAYKGFGVWSLAVMSLSNQTANSLLLWFWNNWRPSLNFSKKSFNEMFGFGSKLLISGLIDTVFNNIYYLIIGKFFSARKLGFYTRAEQFSTIPSTGITKIVSRVSFPIFAQMQDDPVSLKNGYKRIIRSTMFITFILMMGMAAVAEPMVVFLIGEKWRPAVAYLQLMCFVEMLYPLHALNLNILTVYGRSDLFLQLEIIKKVIAIPTIIIGILYGITPMLISMIIASILSFLLNSLWSGKLINYNTYEQIKDLLPSFFIASGNAILVFLIGISTHVGSLMTLMLQLSVSLVFITGLCELTKMRDYLYIKEIILQTIKRRN